MFFFVIHIVGVTAAGGTNSVTSIVVMVWYMILFMIILPYAFLMNTSYNKERIIEHGFINVIKNMTTNNSILASNRLNACCNKESSENAGNKIFVVQGQVNQESSTPSDNIRSISRASPSPMYSDTPLRNNAGMEERNLTIVNKSGIIIHHDANASSRERPSTDVLYKANWNLILSNFKLISKNTAHCYCKIFNSFLKSQKFEYRL